MCWMNPDTAAYTFDTNFNCLNDSTSCSDVQGVIALKQQDDSDQVEGNGIAHQATSSAFYTARPNKAVRLFTTTIFWYASLFYTN